VFNSKSFHVIIIHEKEEDIDYEASVKDFVEKGIEGDFGQGKQIFLPQGNFEKIQSKEKVGES
jgi:hypothetical protein